jgi:hypothetical protein
MPPYLLYSPTVAVFYFLLGLLITGCWQNILALGFAIDSAARVNHNPNHLIYTTKRHRSALVFPNYSTRNSRKSSFQSSLAAATTASPYRSAEYVYFDLQVQGQDIGRLVFQLTIPSPLPLHAENLIQLCRGDQRSIDPAATYLGCAFDYGTDYIEDGRGRYRWSHVLRGKNRNAVGRADAAISDPANQLQCTHSVFGGQYYGEKYDASSRNEGNDDDDYGVLVTVQIRGPGHGSSRWQLVRVGESPPEWGERLLLNTGVIGRLVRGIDTVHAMARQSVGPPTIVQAGILSSEDL